MKNLLIFSIICVALIIGTGLTKKEASKPVVKASAMTIKEARIRAFIDTIAYSEGAGFDTHYGGQKVDISGKGFPCRRIKSGRYTSSACGGFQLMDYTYARWSKKLGINDFSVASQIKIAKALIKNRGAWGHVERGEFRQAVYKTSWEWASFPAPNGQSRYGQRAHSITKLERYYQDKVQRYLRSKQS